MKLYILYHYVFKIPNFHFYYTGVHIKYLPWILKECLHVGTFNTVEGQRCGAYLSQGKRASYSREWLLREQAWVKNLQASRPKQVTSAGPSSFQGPLWEQAWARDIHRTGQSQRPLPKQVRPANRIQEHIRNIIHHYQVDLITEMQG